MPIRCARPPFVEMTCNRRPSAASDAEPCGSSGDAAIRLCNMVDGSGRARAPVLHHDCVRSLVPMALRDNRRGEPPVGRNEGGGLAWAQLQDAIPAVCKVQSVLPAIACVDERTDARLRPAGQSHGDGGGCDHRPILPLASTIVTWPPPATSGAPTRTSRSSPS